jgi:DUF1680 family protein
MPTQEKTVNIRKITPVPLQRVSVDGGFWKRLQETNRNSTLPIQHEQCSTTGRLAAFKLDWKPGDPNQPHRFWDSDIAKWIEAAAYSLTTHPDAELERKVDEAISWIADAQQEDGYLNIFYTVVEPEKRWSHLEESHELYCAGHLIEAAVAYYDATGKHQLLDVMCIYTDYIDSVFGPEEGKIHGYDGHPEIELALIKLYRTTGEPRYLKLCQYFVDERGRQPHFYDQEASSNDTKPTNRGYIPYDYYQAHLPVRDQETVEGHSVRAVYLYSGMADLAVETNDDSLRKACEQLWNHMVEKRMYITGGIGSIDQQERFTYDYDLPNDTAYAETCASIGLIFWAHRMALLSGEGRYMDELERALYNGTISGVSADGSQFFYANHLEVLPAAHHYNTLKFNKTAVAPTRQEWFGCACCPPNIARMIASLGHYMYAEGEGQAVVHLYGEGTADLNIGSQSVQLKQHTSYPWDDKISIEVTPEQAAEFTVSLRIPAWCCRAQLKVNGEQVEIAALLDKGYARLNRLWTPGDRIELTLEMPVEAIESHPEVRENASRIALQRGPVVYCLEETDNGSNLRDIAISLNELPQARYDASLLGGITVLEGSGYRSQIGDWKDQLYRRADTRQDVQQSKERIRIRAVPYYIWGNRNPGEMLVWIARQ